MAKIIIKETGEIKELQRDVVDGIKLTRYTMLNSTNYDKFNEDCIIIMNEDEYDFWQNYFVAHYWVRALEKLQTETSNVLEVWPI